MNEIIEVAFKLFREKGYETTSVTDLCEEMNLTKAGLYHYIKSKEELLKKVDEHYYERIKATMTRERTGQNAEEAFREFLSNFVKEILEDKDVVRFSMTRALSRGSLWGEAKSRRREIAEIVKDKLREIRPKASNMDITTATFVLIGMVTWTSFWFRRDGTMSIDDLVDQLSRLFLRGFLALGDSESGQ